MTQAPSTSIAFRMADHYARQIAWVEESIRALERLHAMSVDENWDEVTANDQRRAAELRALEAEFFALKKEWDATPAFLPGERNMVRTLVLRFKALSAEFQQKLEALLHKLAADGGAMRGELGTLRKARDVMQKFASGQQSGGGFVDRRA
jgi:hypothetical protein